MRVKEILLRYRVVDAPSLPAGLRVAVPEDLAQVFRALLPAEPREHLWVVLLDAKNTVQAVYHAGAGGITECPVSVETILRAVLVGNAASFAVGHRHPSGAAAPSPMDRQLTRTLQQAAKLVGVQCLDHIVLGDDEYFSFCAERLFPLRPTGDQTATEEDPGVSHQKANGRMARPC